jgi:hypothetical protein
MLEDLCGFKLILDVPITTVNRHFELFKRVVFPTRIFNKTHGI